MQQARDLVMTETIPILLVDDDRELGEMLSRYLAREGFSLELAHDGPRGLQRARSGEHDAIILDVMLPGMSGLEVLRELQPSGPAPIIMLTARGEDTDRILGLEMGADDYLPKPFNPRELVARLRAVLRRGQSDGNEPLQFGGIELHRGAHRVSVDGQSVRLTGAEFAILERLMQQPGEVVSKDALAEHALGRSLQPFERAIDTHVSRLRGKLGTLADGSGRIQSIRARGYLLIGEPI